VLLMVKEREENLPRAQSLLSSALYADLGESLRDGFRSMLLRRIQEEPEVTGFNQLLIWFFLQEKQFAAALRQMTALDRRTGAEESQLLNLAAMALKNRNYREASSAYDYLLGKGKEHPFWLEAFNQKMHADYLQFTSGDSGESLPADRLAAQYEEGLEVAGYQPRTLLMIREYAHLLAFYLNEPGKAIAVLEKGLAIPALKALQAGELKAELADIYLYAGDPWEATLLYSQVIDVNRDNSLGDLTKLKKARLAYYMGNFEYAKAQLDVLKASTSKLTANDALELALFIGNNSNLDTTEVPLLYFSRADLLFFRNSNRQAMAVLDSLAELFPYHSLIDDILFRKALIETDRSNHEAAVKYLEEIINDHSYDMLADNALFRLGDIYQFRLRDEAKAAEAYKRILFDFPGSIFVVEARNRYREIQGDQEETLPSTAPDKGNTEQDFFNGKLNPGY